VFQVTNHLAGGCVSNAFVVKGGEMVTPIARGEEAESRGGAEAQSKGISIPSPVLPGVTRGWVLEWAARRRIAVTRRMVTIEDVLGADEVFLTNSSWGVLPVVAVEKKEIGDGEVGALTGEVRGAWEMEQE
jgi:branched-subunit amino acid aminotransferase/4-amino-4-deoxychorismate lyase